MSLAARDFPPGTPLHHFFAWNEAVPWWRRDRRYRLARTPERLPEPIAQALQDGDRQRRYRRRMRRCSPLSSERRAGTGEGRRRILVIRLSALGDFIQALGPIAAIRRHHAGDHVSLLTTRPLAGFAEELGYFDEVIVDERPGVLALRGLASTAPPAAARAASTGFTICRPRTRSAAYAWLLRPGLPEWSGIAWRCSHPHANRDRDSQHTLDKQAEQLLMAGIHPTPLPTLPRAPPHAAGRPAGPGFRAAGAGGVAGPSRKTLARRTLRRRWRGRSTTAGYRAAIVGTAPEAPLAARIREICPAALDLTGQTDLGLLGALAQRAALTVGNDTGVCHLAAAAGCAVRGAVFGRHRSGALRAARPARRGDRRRRFARSGAGPGHRRFRRDPDGPAQADGVGRRSDAAKIAASQAYARSF